MERSERVTTYLNDVCAQVRWKQAHPVIAHELAGHIEDERQSLLGQGFPEEAAEKQAIKEMGDALEVGRRFDEAYRPQKDWSVWIPFAVLMVFGFLTRAYIQGSFFHDYMPLLLLAFLGACFIPVGWLSKWAWLLYGAYFLVLVGPISGVILRALRVRGYNAYADYLLLFLPILSALLIYRMRGRGILGVCLICVAHSIIAWIMLPSYMGNYILIAFACLPLPLYAIVRGWFDCNKTVAALIMVLPVALLLLVIFLVQPYRLIQLRGIIAPSAGGGATTLYGVVVERILSNAKLVGPIDPSFLDGRVSGLVLASADFANNFMLVVLAAKLGKIVFVAAVLLLAAFMFLALRICMKQRSMLGKLISLSVLLTFAAQGAGYIAGNLGITLLLRYPMPFVAFGDQAMLCNLILCGLLFSTFRTGALLDDRVMQRQQRWKIKLVREMD